MAAASGVATTGAVGLVMVEADVLMQEGKKLSEARGFNAEL